MPKAKRTPKESIDGAFDGPAKTRVIDLALSADEDPKPVYVAEDLSQEELNSLYALLQECYYRNIETALHGSTQT